MRAPDHASIAARRAASCSKRSASVAKRGSSPTPSTVFTRAATLSALADTLQIMRQHGSRPKYIHSVWGGNFRMDPIQAAILRVKLRHLDAWQAARRRHAAHYHATLAPLVSRGILRLPPDPAGCPGHVYHHFVIRAPRRDALRAFLTARDIETELYYPLPLHLQPCLSHLGYRKGSLPRTEAAAEEILALPVHADLNPAQLDAVSAAVIEFYR